MADISDVLNALASNISNALYPNGIDQPSIANTNILVYPGWPVRDTLNTDIGLGKAHVSIFPTSIQRVKDRFFNVWQTIELNTPTIILTLQDQDLKISGTISVPQTVMVIYNGIAYAYSIQSTDTLASIATGIANLVPSATATGAIVTFTGAYSLAARLSFGGTSIRELSRREHVISVDVWSPNDTVRTIISSAIEIALNSLVRFPLPDGFWARIKYASMNQVDDLQLTRIYRRNLNYMVEYAVTQTQTDYTIADQRINIATAVINPS